MPWIQAHLIVTKEQAELAELVFENIGAVSITLGDAKDEPVLETLPDEIRLWSLVKVTALFEFSSNISDDIRQHINQAFKRDISQQLEIEILDDQDWERTTRKPTLRRSWSGTTLPRDEQRRTNSMLYQEPPRRVRRLPDEGPGGSMLGLFE